MTGSSLWRVADPAESAARTTRFGGQPTWDSTPRWPVFQDTPLPFLGQVSMPTGEVILMFMSDDEDAQSWEAEGAGPLAIGGEPRWLQYDQTPAAAPVFVCQFDSFPDPQGWISFGDGGWAYLFMSDDRTVARFLWQC